MHVYTRYCISVPFMSLLSFIRIPCALCFQYSRSICIHISPASPGPCHGDGVWHGPWAMPIAWARPGPLIATRILAQRESGRVT